MQPLLNILLWVFFWPVKLLIWLWQHETIGKVFAALWLACLLIIGLGLLPRQAEKIERPSAPSNLAASLQPTLLTILRNAATPLVEQSAGQASTEVTLTKAVLIVATVVNPPHTLPATVTVIDLPTTTLILATGTASPAITATPLLILTSTPLLLLTATVAQSLLPTATQQPTKPPTAIPTVTPFDTPPPDPDSKIVATPIALDPAPTNAVIVIQPTATLAEQISNNPGGFTCAGGCSEAPDPSCAIKGNVNAKGDKIYHMPGGKNYELTRIKPAEGDRWFCTEQEAQDAGFRAAKSY